MSQQQSFWEFACSIYEKPSVQQICLELQNTEGLDVNCLLFCLWSASKGNGVRDDSFWDALVKESCAWQKDIVGPLRSVRNSLKADTHLGEVDFKKDLRDGVLAKELEAEKIQINWIESFYDQHSDMVEPMDAAECLFSYINALPFQLGEKGKEKTLSLSTVVL